MKKSIYYEGTEILRNKFNLNDQDKLNQMERIYSLANLTKLKEDPIKGNFDMKHLQAIHKELFKEVYDWAGETRNYEIEKGTAFCPLQHLDSYQQDVFGKLKKENYLKDLDIDHFSKRAAHYLGEINMLHPFLEGNGRTQREFMRVLAHNAGYELTLDSEAITKERMIAASVKSANGHNDEFEQIIRENVRPIALKRALNLTEIKNATAVKDLPTTALIKDLYNAYAKETVLENCNVWTDKTNSMIIEKMLRNEISSSKIQAALKYSPTKVDKIYSLVKSIENKPEIKALKKSRGMEM